MNKRSFGVDFSKGREVTGSLFIEHVNGSEFARFLEVGPDLKVSCPFGGCGGACSSPSRREKSWVCGSNFSHNDRLGRCIAYRRLRFRIPDGARCRRRSR